MARFLIAALLLLATPICRGASQAYHGCGGNYIFLDPSLKNCTTLTAADVRIGDPTDGQENITIEGFQAVTGRLSYSQGTAAKTITCDASYIGVLSIEDAASLQKISLPKLASVGSILIRNAGNLTSLDAPLLKTVSQGLSLEDVPKLTNLNLYTPVEPYSSAEFRVGYDKRFLKYEKNLYDNELGSGGFVHLSNVSQQVVNTMFSASSAHLANVTLTNIPQVRVLNYSAEHTDSLTVQGSGELRVTFPYNGRGDYGFDVLSLSGISEIDANNGTAGHHPMPSVNEIYIMNNPQLKEAFIALSARKVLKVANNAQLETIRFQQQPLGPLQELSIVNNTKLRMSSTTLLDKKQGPFSRSSDNSSDIFAWTFVECSKMAHFDGDFNNAFFEPLEDSYSIGPAFRGDFIINSTAPGFDCGRVRRFNTQGGDTTIRAVLKCNGVQTLPSSANTLFASQAACILAALLSTVFFLL